MQRPALRTFASPVARPPRHCPLTFATMSQSQAAAWNPQVYGQRFVEERRRPGIELIDRARYALSQSPLSQAGPRVAVDLGCGTGRFMPAILEAFPTLDMLTGFDHSDNMLVEAKQFTDKSLSSSPQQLSKITFQNGSIDEFVAEPKADLVYSNAAIQWLRDQHAVITKLVSQLSSGGILAVQIPNDFDRPSHTEMFNVMQAMEDGGELPAGITEKLHRTSASVDGQGLIGYHALLRPLSSYLDVWDTTYLHNASCPIVDGQPAHPVAFFLQGSSLGQVLHALPAGKRDVYLARFIEKLNIAYPVWRAPGVDGRDELHCVFPFSRWFMVAVKK